MVTLVKIEQVLQAGVEVKEYRGLSTDSKPTTDVGNGSTFFEMDTKKAYMFNGTSSTWTEI